MIGAIFAAHSLLVRDYPNAPPPPPAPPAPPTPPSPPQAAPIAFSVVARDSLFGIIGSAIGATTLATVTCADAAMTIVQSEAVAGLTFSYAANVLTIAGTPTGSTRVQRVVVSYISSDGNKTVRGSTAHKITLVSASEVLTIGNMNGASGTVDRPMTVTLASPSSNYAVDVTAAASNLVPGLTASLAWTKGVSSGAGPLTVAGTPTKAGTYSLVVNYTANEQAVGTSTHAVVIVNAYQAPVAAPAPSPSPAPPAPSPPPVPAPAPAPGMGPDFLFSSVKALLHFDRATGLTTDVKGNVFEPALPIYVTGVVGEAAQLIGYSAGPFNRSIQGTVAGCDGADGNLTVECFVKLGVDGWAALTAGDPGQQLFMPAISYTATDGTLLWALGFYGYKPIYNQAASSNYNAPAVWPAFYTYLKDGVPVLSRGLRYTTRTLTFKHMMGSRRKHSSFAFAFQGCWLDYFSESPTANLIASISNIYPSASGVLRFGGSCGRPIVNGAPATVLGFDGEIDMGRITTADRYGRLDDVGNAYGLTDAMVFPLPWPNY